MIFAACALASYRRLNYSTNNVTTWLVEAGTADEARGKALVVGEAIYPRRDGWTDLVVMVSVASLSPETVKPEPLPDWAG